MAGGKEEDEAENEEQREQ